MRVLLFHPEWARSCADCLSWLYDDDGHVTKRCGEPVKRLKGVPTPCHKCPKIPAELTGEERVRQNAVELSEHNYRAYLHYLECRAVGKFPDDPIVRRNARILRALHDEMEQRPLWKMISLVGLGHGR